MCVHVSLCHCHHLVQRGRNVEVYLKDLVNSTECPPQASGSAWCTAHTHARMHAHMFTHCLCSQEAHAESPLRAAATRRELERYLATQEADRDKADRYAVAPRECGGGEWPEGSVGREWGEDASNVVSN